VCDRDTDCTDGSDESPAICRDRKVCSTDEYRCERSGECVDYSRVCNGKSDCSDGSDEHGCNDDGDDSSHPHAGSDCPHGQFSCDQGICFPIGKQCDGQNDCFDGADEIGCEKRLPHVQVMGIEVDNDDVNSTAIHVNWWVSDINKDKIMYQPAYSVVGTDHWLFEPWQSIAQYTYVFSGLMPYTKYNLTMNIRDGDVVYNTTKFATAMTTSDVPSPPTIIEVVQVDKRVRVSWTPPVRINGHLEEYTVTMAQYGNLIGQWKANNESFLIDSLFADNANYSFTVMARNHAFSGIESDPSYFVYRSISLKTAVEKIAATPLENPIRIELSWSISQTGETIEMFHISCKSRNLLAPPIEKDVAMEASKSDLKTTLFGLSPNESYTLAVFATAGNRTGPTARYDLTTVGRSLPKPIITEAQISPESGTSIKLSWKLPDDEKRRNNVSWTYGVFYGRNEGELLRSGIRANVSDRKSFTVEHLQSCESYSFVVAVTGPEGIGPASDPVSKVSKYSPGAPPKNVTASIDSSSPTLMLITWQASCKEVDDSIGYVVQITNLVTGTNTVKQLTKGTRTSFELPIKDIPYGSSFNVSVRTDVPDSASSPNVTVIGPQIPPPHTLTYNIPVKSGNSEDSADLVRWP
jgi:hypothetical protein